MQVRVARQRWETGQRERARETVRLTEAQAALRAAEQAAHDNLENAEQVLRDVLDEQANVGSA